MSANYNSPTIGTNLCKRATRGGGHLGHFPPPENFKTVYSNFDSCKSFQRIKTKFYILIIF